MLLPEDKLQLLGIILPQVSKPIAAYVPYKIAGNLLFLSGILPVKEGILMARGKVNREVTIEEGYTCAKQVALNAIAIMKEALGSLNNVEQIIKVTGYVASSDNFNEQSKVINGCSDLLIEIFDDKGKHARTAVGVKELPMNAPVEIDFIVETVNSR